MADHDEEEEFLEIGILLFSRQQSRKARKVPTSRKKNIWARKVLLVKKPSFGFIFEVGKLFIVQQVTYICVQPLPLIQVCVTWK